MLIASLILMYHSNKRNNDACRGRVCVREPHSFIKLKFSFKINRLLNCFVPNMNK